MEHHPYHREMNAVRLSSAKQHHSMSMASMATLAASVGPISPHRHQHNNNNNSVHHHHHPQLPAVISHLCAGCGHLIKDRYLLQALDSYWHEDCLKCSCCGCRLGEVGSNLFTKANLMLCKRDYLRLFGATGNCAACCKPIPAFEMVMRAKTNVYHLDCFACQQCHQRFCVGDRFYLCDNQILCEYDYEERLVFANASSSACVSQPVSSRSGHEANRQTQTADDSNQTTRIAWTSPAFAETRPEASSSSVSLDGSTVSNVAKEQPRFQPPDSSPAGLQQHQVVEHDASSSGYGSPDSGGLIDEG
ncbi:hypothetical protein GHT06_020004 [Daphnia sinensis]|uniref:LIM zinc-binding domain-containing protein n=1 Tax=Daphnia sinensis TaxID=1820382 RepID=A0AAD5PR46_9CRUS|nr:hypothetical protein GHT06_020004 [Daphnia sinensis]